MKILALVIGVGFLQVLVNGIVDFIPHPKGTEHCEVEERQERWNCPHCENDNGDWTIICGRCGRTKGSMK